MKLYTGFSPSGSRVAVFLQEKGLDIPIEPVSVLAGETQSSEFKKINPLGEIPVLELDDGQFLTESIAICRYLEELHPTPALFGATPEERAFVEMWNRRVEQRLLASASLVGLHELELFKDRIDQNAAFAASQRKVLAERLSWFDTELADGRPFVTGDQFTVADITGMAMLLVSRFTGIEFPADLKNLNRWAQELQSRASFPQMPKAA